MKSMLGTMAIALFAMTLAAPVAAEVFQCRDGHGKLIYQEAPCSRAAGQTPVSTQRTSTDRAPTVSGETLGACLKRYRGRFDGATFTARAIRDTDDGVPMLILSASMKTAEGRQQVSEVRCALNADLTIREPGVADR